MSVWCLIVEWFVCCVALQGSSVYHAHVYNALVNALTVQAPGKARVILSLARFAELGGCCAALFAVSVAGAEDSKDKKKDGKDGKEGKKERKSKEEKEAPKTEADENKSQPSASFHVIMPVLSRLISRILRFPADGMSLPVHHPSLSFRPSLMSHLSHWISLQRVRI